MHRHTLLTRIAGLALVLASGAAGLSCMTAYRQSIGGGDPTQLFTKIYLTDFNTSWQSVLDALKNSALDVSNREGGYVQTKWTDNTAEKNFVEAFGSADAYLKSQYRFRVTLSKGYYEGKPSVKVAVQKDQVVEKDVLDGFRVVETDGIEEKTLLYRIGRIIFIRMKLAQLEDLKNKKAMDSDSGFPTDSASPVPSAGSDADTAQAAPRPSSKPKPKSDGADLDQITQ